jgi:uncharacterized coiled-coil DUF342 family protein
MYPPSAPTERLTMNKDRRKTIASITEQLAELEALRDSIKEAIEEVRDEEQEYFDNMPEGFQMADRGQAAEGAISNLENAISQLEDLDVSGIQGDLESAAE